MLNVTQSSKLAWCVAGGVLQYRLGVPPRLIAGWTRDRMIDLGPSFVKLGQMVACRPDVFPNDVVREFAPLLTDVPPVPYADVEHAVPAGVTVDPTPIAAGSIAQVHRGQYRQQQVVVKVMQPWTSQRIMSDIETMRGIVRAGVGLVPSLADLDAFLDQFEILAANEVNFVREVGSMRAYRATANPLIQVPAVYEELCSPQAIVMEYCPSAGASQFKLQANRAECKSVANRLMHAYLHRLLTRGSFHADPHPGNIGFTGGGRVVLYDFGSVMQLDDATCASLRTVCACIVTGDLDDLVDQLVRHQLIIPLDGRAAFDGASDMPQIRRYVQALMQYVRTTDIEQVASTLRATAGGEARSPFEFAPTVVLMLRAIAMLEGTCKELDPEFSYVASLAALFLTDAGAQVLATRAERDVRRLYAAMGVLD